MKQPAQEQFQVAVFSPHTAKVLVDYISALPEGRWYFRAEINSIPTQGSVKSSYWFMGDRQQPKELSEYLFDIAPKIDGLPPVQACINRYLPGDYMPEHIDIGLYRQNMVVALTDTGEGVTVGGRTIIDEPGVATVYPAKSDPHQVLPVKELRFVLIYLYE